MRYFEQSNPAITVWQEFAPMGVTGKHVIQSNLGIQSKQPDEQSPHAVFPFLVGQWLFWFELGGDDPRQFRAKHLTDGEVIVYQAHRNLSGNIHWVTDGRFVLAAHIAMFNKGYDPYDIIGVIFDTQTKAPVVFDLEPPDSPFIMSGAKVLELGGIHQQTLWIKDFGAYGYNVRRIKSLILENGKFRITWDGMQPGTSAPNAWKTIEWTRWTRTIDPATGASSVPVRLIAQPEPLT